MELPVIWQDYVITVGQALFWIALLPMVISPDKPHWVSSLMTGIILLVFGYTFWTLNVIWGSMTSVLVGITWLVLFIQKIGQMRTK